MKRIECIIMDWAGSAVDYGCFAPVAAFLKAFNEIGINITMEQARRPMGMAKIDHIRELFKMGGVGEEFEKLYHRPWNEQDVTDMNAKFEEYLFASLANYTNPIPGVIDTLNELRKQGIKIGSTTGYTQAMMDVVLPNATRRGYELLIYYGKFSFQSEYIRTQVKRRNALADYTGQGGYAQCSWLLIGNTYDYDAAPACPSRPIGRALELCGRFNIVDMNDRTAEVLGGAQKDLSLGLNYYINKHIGIKVNYSYVIPGKHIRKISDKNFSILQARFQFIL